MALIENLTEGEERARLKHEAEKQAETEQAEKEAEERAIIQAGQAKLDAINARMEAKKAEREPHGGCSEFIDIEGGQGEW